MPASLSSARLVAASAGAAARAGTGGAPSAPARTDARATPLGAPGATPTARTVGDADQKLALQAEISRMRKEFAHDPRGVRTTYPLAPPYSFAEIRFNPAAGEHEYLLHEPRLRPGEPETLEAVRDKIEALTQSEELPIPDLGRLGDSAQLQEFLHERYLHALDLYDIHVPTDRRDVLFYYLQRDLVGLGRSDGILRDPFLEDVGCNGPDVPVFVFHRVYGSLRTNVAYHGEMELNRYILKLAQFAGKHVSVYQPILDATLRDGSRLNLTLGTEVTRRGSTFSIRRFTQDPITPIDLMRFGSGSAHEFAYFWHLIENKRSILVSGGTASGKTTLLNALSMFIRHEDKIVSIEDTPEIHLAHSNWIQSVSRAGYGAAREGAPGAIHLFDLLVAALRQRPEYILVGEVRGKEAATLFQAIATGHAAMATIHAGSVGELLHRLENQPMNIPRVLLEALDAVAFPAQVATPGGRGRRVRLVSEILGVDPGTNNLLTNDVFQWQPEADQHRFMGRSFVLERIAEERGVGVDAVERELARKTEYLDRLAARGLSHVHDFTRAVRDYHLDARAALDALR